MEVVLPLGTCGTIFFNEMVWSSSMFSLTSTLTTRIGPLYMLPTADEIDKFRRSNVNDDSSASYQSQENRSEQNNNTCSSNTVPDTQSTMACFSESSFRKTEWEKELKIAVNHSEEYGHKPYVNSPNFKAIVDYAKGKYKLYELGTVGKSKDDKASLIAVKTKPSTATMDCINQDELTAWKIYFDNFVSIANKNELSSEALSILNKDYKHLKPSIRGMEDFNISFQYLKTPGKEGEQKFVWYMRYCLSEDKKHKEIIRVFEQARKK